MDLGRINERVDSIAREVAERNGLEFLRTEIGGTKRSPVVRIIIDREAGLTVEHCADVSRAVEERLDDEDIIPTKYVLEVSSPGLERDLLTVADFQRFAGKLAKVKTAREVDGAKFFIGRIDGVKGNDIMLDLGNSRIVNIPFDAVAKANLKLDLDAELKGK